MQEAEIAQCIVDTFPGVETTENLGYRFFFYGTDRMLPFATIATAGTDYERISNHLRPGVFRLNNGVSRPTFRSLFGVDHVALSHYDYTALDRIMPHPDYAAQNWICVHNPTESTFESVRTFLAEAYELARVRAAKRTKSE